MREVPGSGGFRTFVLADPLYSFIHRTEGAKSVARLVAPGAQVFGGGTGIALRFFDELGRAVELEVPGAEDLAAVVLSGGALFFLCSYFLDPESHLAGERSLPWSVAQERCRLLWHERVWQGVNLLPPSIWTEIVDHAEAADSQDLTLLRQASKKTAAFTRTADLLARAFVEKRAEIDTERLIRRDFPARLHPALRSLRDDTRPTAGEIEAIVGAAARLGPWPRGLDLAENTMMGSAP